MKTISLSLLAVLIFTAGVGSQFLFSAIVGWADLEASMYGPQTAAGVLNLQCPIMLSPAESGTVSTVISNSLDIEVLPVVTADISRASGLQSLSQTLTLAPHRTQYLQWPIDASDVIFGRLILINITQARYNILDPREGSCGIVVFSLFNLSGGETLGLIMVGSLLLILLGGAFWNRMQAPLDALAQQLFKACQALAAVTTLSDLTALLHWWVLSLTLIAIAFIMVGIILTEFVRFPDLNEY